VQPETRENELPPEASLLVHQTDINDLLIQLYPDGVGKIMSGNLLLDHLGPDRSTKRSPASILLPYSSFRQIHR